MPIEASLAARGNEHGIAEVPDAGSALSNVRLLTGKLRAPPWPKRFGPRAARFATRRARQSAKHAFDPYLDWWRACPRCGAPFGRVQCSECNPVTMAALDRHELPFDACASAVVYNDATARIVRAWKDAGERRLVETLADLMASVTAPSWRAERPTIVPVPATAAALRRRGFDHGADLARALAERLSLDEIPLLARPRSFDQRSLARSGRIKNMENRFKPLPGARAPASVLIVDDVYTTGATLFAASEAARAAGARQVRCVTFARVW